VEIFTLAASYAFGIARNHAFVDGNKRTANVVSEAFLYLNGWIVPAPKDEKYFAFLHLADGTFSEAELTAWFRTHAILL
jgi:death-on-curing protein